MHELRSVIDMLVRATTPTYARARGGFPTRASRHREVIDTGSMRVNRKYCAYGQH